MKTLVAIFINRQFLLFLVIGGLAAGIHWFARIFINQFFNYEISLILSYVIGIVTGYILNIKFVFSSKSERRIQEITHFIGFNVAMFPVVTVVSWVLSEILLIDVLSESIRRPTSHAIAVISPVFFNFLYHKFLTFKET